MPGKLNRAATLAEMKRLYASLLRLEVGEVRVTVDGNTIQFAPKQDEATDVERCTDSLAESVRLHEDLSITSKKARDLLPRALPYAVIEKARMDLKTTLKVTKCRVCGCHTFTNFRP